MNRDATRSLLPASRGADETQEAQALGLRFDNEEGRRAHFTEKLREHLADRALRKIEGVPCGPDEAILRLSDPPHFTACPNAFVGDLIAEFRAIHGAGRNGEYQREPFSTDVSEGKDDTIYMAHSYHTKVPYKAILRHILHYTEPGDVILDGFCGSGMTGVAATLCSQADGETRQAIEREMPGVKWGPRLAVLSDLSPAACFIAYNYNTIVDVPAFQQDAESLLDAVSERCGDLFATDVQPSQGSQAFLASGVGQQRHRINFTVWSEVFTCSNCTQEISFYDHAVDTTSDPFAIRDEFPCPGCRVALTKRTLEPCLESVFDPLLKQTIQRRKRVPVALHYLVGSRRYSKPLDPSDLATINAVDLAKSPVPLPVVEFPRGSLADGNRQAGFTHLHHYYTPRNLITLATMLAEARGPWRHQLMLLVQAISVRLCSLLTTYQLGKRGNVPMTGTLYVASLTAEANPLKAFEGKLRDFVKVFGSLKQRNIVSCGSSTDLRMIKDNSIDYVFVDPPFGNNLNYAQLNFLWEGWLGVRTNVETEAIVDTATNRPLRFYQETLRRCLAEFCRVLKPGRWMTMVFHNSKNAVWNAIQEALWQSGFVIADVRTLDKKQGTPKQVNSANAVKQDLIISAYKPAGPFEEQFRLAAGSEDGAWQFVRDHLAKLPVFVARHNRVEMLNERQPFLLFDRMVAFHVQRGVSVPISAGDFYAGLAQRFPERDGMYFLPDQVAEYDKKRMTVAEIGQMELIPVDEQSSIQWLRQQLREKPQTFQELHPTFLKLIGGWSKHERVLELRDLLEENFLCYDGRGEVPSQVHAYLSSNFRPLRNLAKDDPALREKAKDRWYVPDPNKASDLEKLRERTLLREFDEYRQNKQKTLKVFRLESVRAGFKAAYDRQDYETIVSVARRIPESILQEDEKLLMYYDVARMRTGKEDLLEK